MNWITACVTLLIIARGDTSYYASYAPQHVMVDVTNDFGICVLQLVSSRNENIAFSPYGLVSVALVLYEGSRGPTAAEIHNSLHLPWDRQVTRIGFRDMHRYLKSYFSNDGFLRGLVLSKPNVAIHQEFSDMLSFYGFAVQVSPNSTTTAKPNITDEITPSTTPNPGNSSESGPEFPVNTTEASVDPLTTVAPVNMTEEIDTGTELVTEVPVVIKTERLTEAPIQTTTELAKNEIFTSTTGATTQVPLTTSSPTVKLTDKKTEMPNIIDQVNMILTTITPVESKDLEMELSTIKAEVSVTKTTMSKTVTVIDPNTTPMSTINNDMKSSGTESVLITTDNEVASSRTESSVQIISEATVTPTVEATTARTSTPPEIQTTAEVPIADEITTVPDVKTSADRVQTTPEITTVPDVQTTSADRVQTTPEVTTDAEAQTSPDISISTEATTPESILVTEVSQTTVQVTDETTIVQETVATTELPTNQGSRKKRAARTRSASSSDLVAEHRGELSNWVPNQEQRWNYNQPSEQWFFTYNGGKNVPVLSYTAYLPYAYIYDIQALALQLPLDDPRYSMVILLPEERRGLENLLYSLQWCPIKTIMSQLKPTGIYAVVPTFSIVKHINLGPALAQLGVTSLFDPFKSDLSAMSNEPNLFVRTVEQVVTVSLRKYYSSHRWFDATPSDVRQHFIANHPFVYFVIDKETQVTLMLGTVVNPGAHNQA